MKTLYLTLAIFLFIALTGCMPKIYPPGEKTNLAHLDKGLYVTEDGAHLPLRQWLPHADTKAVLIALHGFNDYSHFFDSPGSYLSSQGIACFAYDQRGFGASPQRGLWAGAAAYTNDLKVLVHLLKQRYPRQPIYLLGESMGGAVVITAMSKTTISGVDGIILSAPAIWARSTMPWYQTGLLWTLSHSMPWLTLTGKGVKITPSDNIEMLRALGRDPWIIKKTRVDALHGLTDLMDMAYAGVTTLQGNTLLLYGEKDEIIPKKATYQFLQKLLSANATGKKVAIYPHGYHMLLRDLQALTAWQDIAAWIEGKPQQLPSGADSRAHHLLAQLVSDTAVK